MQLFTPPNILFVLLFAFFARSSPIDDNAKTRLVQQGASFLDLDPEPKPPGGPVIKSFGTKNIPSQNAQPPAGKLPPIPQTGSTKPLSRDDIQKKIAALPKNDWSGIETLPPPPSGPLPPLPNVLGKQPRPVLTRPSKEPIRAGSPKNTYNSPPPNKPTEDAAAPLHQVKDEDFLNPRVAPPPPKKPTEAGNKKPGRAARLKNKVSLMKGKLKKAAGH